MLGRVLALTLINMVVVVVLKQVYELYDFDSEATSFNPLNPIQCQIKKINNKKSPNIPSTSA